MQTIRLVLENNGKEIATEAIGLSLETANSIRDDELGANLVVAYRRLAKKVVVVAKVDPKPETPRKVSNKSV